MNATPVVKRHPGQNVIILAGSWLVAYFAARGLLKLDTLETWLRVAIALVPMPIFALFLLSYIRLVRVMDELERRVHLEALGIAYALALLLLTTLALMQRAVDLKFEDWSYAHVWVYLPLFYFGALIFANKRYQDE